MTQFLNSRSDCEWLKTTHLKNLGIKANFRSFILEGNEDCPTKITLYRDANPRFDARPIAVINLSSILTDKGAEFFNVDE